MTTERFTAWLQTVLEIRREVAGVATFSEAELLTTDDGLVVQLADGSEFALGISQTNPGTDLSRV